MPRRTIAPTDQTAGASSAGVGSVTDTAQADPVTGTLRNVSITVNCTFQNDGGSGTVSYTLDGAAFTNIRSVADTGGALEPHTDTVDIGTVDTTLLAVRVSAFAGPGNTADTELLSWTVTHQVNVGIIDG